MTTRIMWLTLFSACSLSCGGTDTGTGPSGSGTPMSFFVTSATSTTGNIGGLAGADNLCRSLANSVGAGRKAWRAYLSVEHDASNGNNVTNARDRIGKGPWVNAEGVVVARNVTELHSRTGDAALFLDEKGQRINGQWRGSPAPVEHDIMTGSRADGTLLTGFTCGDWTSSSATAFGQVGHSDGLGPNGDTSGTLSSWNSAHSNQNCANTAPRGGAGRIYCFEAN